MRLLTHSILVFMVNSYNINILYIGSMGTKRDRYCNKPDSPRESGLA